MSEDGSVDFSVGVEITNIKSFVDQIKKELVDVVPTSPEIDEKKRNDPNYKKSFEDLAEDKKIIHAIGMKFDEIMAEFKDLAFAQNTDLMKDIQSALKKLPDNFSVNLANAEGLIEKLAVSVQEMLKSGNIKVQVSDDQTQSEQVKQVIQEIDTSRLDGIVNKIFDMVGRAEDAQGMTALFLEILDLTITRLSNISGGTIAISDVQHFTRLILSQTMREASIQSQAIGQFQRATVISQLPTTEGTIETIQQMGTEEFLKHGLTPEQAGLINEADLIAQVRSTETAIKTYQENIEGADQILEKIKSSTGITLRETELRDPRMQRQVLSAISSDELLQLTNLLVGIRGIASVNVSGRVNPTTGVYLHNIHQRTERDRVEDYIERRDYGHGDAGADLLNMAIGYNPQQFERYFGTLFSTVAGRDTMREQRARDFQIDVGEIEVKEGLTEVDLANLIKEELHRTGDLSEKDALGIIMKNLQPTGVEIKNIDKISANMIEDNVSRMEIAIGKFAFDFLDKMKTEMENTGSQLGLTDQFSNMEQAVNAIKDGGDEIRTLFKQITRLMFVFKSGALTPSLERVARREGMDIKSFTAQDISQVVSSVRSGDPTGLPNISLLPANVTATAFEQEIISRGGTIAEEFAGHRDEIINQHASQIEQVRIDNEHVTELMGEVSEALRVLQAIQQKYRITRN